MNDFTKEQIESFKKIAKEAEEIRQDLSGDLSVSQIKEKYKEGSWGRFMYEKITNKNHIFPRIPPGGQCAKTQEWYMTNIWPHDKCKKCGRERRDCFLVKNKKMYDECDG